MSQKRVFITGGASGLGFALASRYASAGWKVCIGDVHEARGQAARAELAKTSPDAIFARCDVRREEDLKSIAKTLQMHWGGVDVVVNNAGVAQAGAIEDVTLDDWVWILDINLLGVVRGCKVFTPIFKQQGSGYFVNIASMAGLLDVPRMSSYNASKAAVVSLSETLQLELMPDNIGVSVVCPGFFKTGLGESLRSTQPEAKGKLQQLMEQSPLSAADVAGFIFDAVQKREFYVLPHPAGRKAWSLKRSMPRAEYVDKIAKNLQGTI